MKVFGIGLSRTGTTSLNRALTLLGYKAFHFPPMLRVLDILEEYDAATDSPIACSYPLLDRLFPGSKFILTVRNPTEWRKSVRNSLSIYPPGDWTFFLHQAVVGTPEHPPVGLDLTHLYWSHNAFAEEYFKDRPEDFMAMDVGSKDAWARLCEFLGKPVPSFDFPHENRS
jgi:hypothetical protein